MAGCLGGPCTYETLWGKMHNRHRGIDSCVLLCVLPWVKCRLARVLTDCQHRAVLSIFTTEQALPTRRAGKLINPIWGQ